jgi:hypothetical protein
LDYSRVSRGTYQENNRQVQQECYRSVKQEREESNIQDLIHGQLGELQEQRNETVHQSTNGRKVVQRDHGIHFEFGRAEQALNHGETCGFADNAQHAEDESDEDELDLTDRSDNDSNHDGCYISKCLETRGVGSKYPGRE